MWTALAYAQGAQSQGSGGSLMLNLIPFALIILIFYFLLIRPQSKERKRLQAMIDALKKGDRVTTTGGLIGTIQSVDKDTAVLQIAENVRVRILRSAVTALRSEE
ncbi:MAG: preprotein translocase subunit YajC [Nitrospirae bacterium]|nr:preprotein translocase subunit YajC [Nitrospirota bacterium]